MNIELYPSPNKGLLSEGPFPLSSGPKMVSMSKSALYQMIRDGRTNYSGERIHLEWCATEGGICTSVAALRRFRQRLNA